MMLATEITKKNMLIAIPKTFCTKKSFLQRILRTISTHTFLYILRQS